MIAPTALVLATLSALTSGSEQPPAVAAEPLAAVSSTSSSELPQVVLPQAADADADAAFEAEIRSLALIGANGDVLQAVAQRLREGPGVHGYCVGYTGVWMEGMISAYTRARNTGVRTWAQEQTAAGGDVDEKAIYLAAQRIYLESAGSVVQGVHSRIHKEGDHFAAHCGVTKKWLRGLDQHQQAVAGGQRPSVTQTRQRCVLAADYQQRSDAEVQTIAEQLQTAITKQ